MSILAFPSAGKQCKTATKLYFKGLIESRIVVKVVTCPLQQNDYSSNVVQFRQCPLMLFVLLMNPWYRGKVKVRKKWVQKFRQNAFETKISIICTHVTAAKIVVLQCPLSPGNSLRGAVNRWCSEKDWILFEKWVELDLGNCDPNQFEWSIAITTCTTRQ